MVRTMIMGGRWWVAATLLTLGFAHAAVAIYLDEGQNFSLRARIYSQASIRTKDSQPGTVPTTKTGQLVQHRNFYNPELDAKLTPYTHWMKGTFLDWLAPDDFDFRLAGWGFYDGIYDYGSRQFDQSQRVINSTFDDFAARPKTAWILEGAAYDGNAKSVATIYPGASIQRPRNIYANQNRVNELYLNYTKGPVFVRLGRQFISWGESDTVALLDQNNPFDFTLGAPGVFQDIEESRIPLWTVRSSVTLFDTLGPLSSGFIEGYWVPGDIDQTTGYLPMRTASPYSPRGTDPQQQIPSIGNIPLSPAQFVLLDRVPQKHFEQSRYGVRLQTVVNRAHTVSAWWYTTFPSPVPQALGLVRTAQLCQVGSSMQPCQLSTTQTVHGLTGVVGLADTFFLEPVDGIIRMEAEYFIGEPSFIPQVNLNITDALHALDPITKAGKVPKANYLRWELGYDRFFFVRSLNPTNSFTFTAAAVGSWNLDETSLNGDFKQQGQFKQEYLSKPAGTPPTPEDFVDQKVVEAFGQMHLQTDYLHGRLAPAVTYIQYVRGTYAILPAVTYRWTDWLLFQLSYVQLGGEYQQIGFFRDRTQLSLRATYQLN
jgi:hypothetical protein